MTVRKSGTLMWSYGGAPLQTDYAQYISNNASDRVVAGAGGNDVFGRGGNDVLYGMGGNDVMSGGKGKDTLWGGKGKDYFVFDNAAAVGNLDTIRDFSRKQGDKIVLSLKYYAGLQTALNVDELGNTVTKFNSQLDMQTASLKVGAFQLGPVALEEDDRILYDQASGQLFYDPDGNGAAEAIQFAKLKAGTALKYTDLIIY